MNATRALFDAFARAADGYQRDQVVGASTNLLMNALRQNHKTRAAAEEELDALVATMKAELARLHYDENGRRIERRIMLPPLGQLMSA